MFCNGALLPISENDALFTLIGTTYGGDGQSTFALPNLGGRTPVHPGQGPGLSQNYQQGETGGVESVTLSVNQIPSHTHPMLASTNPGIASNAQGNTVCSSPSINLYVEARDRMCSSTPRSSRRAAAASRTRTCSLICLFNTSYRCSAFPVPIARSRRCPTLRRRNQDLRR